MLYISLSTGRSATRFWRKCIYANAVMLISRLRSFSPAPGGPGAYVFLGWTAEGRRPFAIPVQIFCCFCHTWYNEIVRVTLLSLLCSWWFRRFYGVCFGRLHGPVTCVLGVLEGWNFLCIVTPSWGADHQNFKKKFDEKKFFFVLLVPLTFRLITHVLRVLGVWNLLCALTPLMRDRLPHFCLKNWRKLFIFSTFLKKKPFLGEFPLLRLITSVLMDLGVWNLLCVFTPSRGTE